MELSIDEVGLLIEEARYWKLEHLLIALLDVMDKVNTHTALAWGPRLTFGALRAAR